MLDAVTVTVTQASPDRLGALASVLGRAFVTEPMGVDRIEDPG